VYVLGKLGTNTQKNVIEGRTSERGGNRIVNVKTAKAIHHIAAIEPKKKETGTWKVKIRKRRETGGGKMYRQGRGDGGVEKKSRKKSSELSQKAGKLRGIHLTIEKWEGGRDKMRTLLVANK